MWYEFRCPEGHVFERELPVDDRNTDQTCPGCGLGGATRMVDFTSLLIAIPKRLHTSFSDVHGMPGSPQREQFDKDVKSGAIVYAGPGSRWV